MKTFQQHLREEHSKNYMGTDDDMPETFEKWLSDLSIDEWFAYGNSFGIFIIKECTKAINNI